MTSMRERAERIGASLTFVTAPRAGTEVVLAWQPAAFSIPGAGQCRPLNCRWRRPAPRAQRARVLVVDDHSLLRTGVANIINQEPATSKSSPRPPTAAMPSRRSASTSPTWC